MKGNQIRLTEQDLHMLVEDAVINILKENGMEEDVLGGLKSLGGRMFNKMNKTGNYQTNTQQQTAQPQGNIFNRMGQRLNNFGNSVSNGIKSYQMGSANGDAQKAITKALDALKALKDASNRQQQIGGNGLQGQAKIAVDNAIKALEPRGNQGDPRNQFQGSANGAASGGKFKGWN